MARFRKRLIFITVALLVILAGGTLGFVLIDDYPPFDAFYMTLVTISTVGYEEVHKLSHAGRVFNSFLIFFGVTIMLLAVGGMTQAIIELELNQYFGKRRTKKMIDALQDHYIVCGYGRVGRGAAGELQRAGVPFLIVDKDEDRVEWAIKTGMLAALADATDDETLINAGVLRAKGLIATLQSDADNLFLILSAKAMKPSLLVSARVNSEQSEKKMRLAGADYVFAPYDMTGNRMAQVMLKPHVFQFIDFTNQGYGAGRRHRADAGARARPVRIEDAARRTHPQRHRGDRACDSKGQWQDAL
jgi:voltage-gated potassium channel